jgi:hypothetical protein
MTRKPLLRKTLGKVLILAWVYSIMASRSRARSGTFFLRTEQDTAAASALTSTSIDVSSFVNVLDGELLRIKQVWFSWSSDNGAPILGADVGTSKGCSATAVITTEEPTSYSFVNNDLVAKNILYAHSDSNTDLDFITNETSVNPMDFDDGFLVATDAIFLAAGESADAFANRIRASVIMECEIVKLSLTDAQAVLVSQTVG